MTDIPFQTALFFTDPTPNAIINRRIVTVGLLTLMNHTDMTEAERKEFLDLLIATCRKMVSVWKRLEAYRTEEDRLIKQYEAGAMHIDYGQNLLDEFDGFSVQIKSTLDHAVKLLKPVFGKKWTVHTFGDKGETVFSALERNTGKAYEGRVRFIKRLCFTDNQKGWLRAIIDARNRVNKFQDGGLDQKAFLVFRNPKGEIEVPRWSVDQTVRSAMEWLWAQFFFFIEDFVICTLNFRLRDDASIVRIHQPIESGTPSWSAMPRLLADDFIKRHRPDPI